MSDQQQYENEYGYEYGQQPHQHQQQPYQEPQPYQEHQQPQQYPAQPYPSQQQFEQHGMSGFPIDPGVGAPQTAESDAERTAYLPPIPAAPSQSQQAHQAAQASYGYPQPGGPVGYGGHGSDAEQTAYLPPIVDGHAPDAYPAAAGQSRFGHIQGQEHYGTGEFPVQQPVAEPLAQAAPASMPAAVPEAESADSPWPDGWERPAAPPAAWAPQPSGAAPTPPQPSVAAQTPPRHAAPQPQGFALGSVEAGPGESLDNAFEQTSYMLSVPAPVAAEPKAAAASAEPDNALEQTSYMLSVPAAAEPGNAFEETSYLLAVPAPENASEQTAYLPPIPPLPSGAGAPGGLGAPGGPGGSLREAFAAAQPTGPVAGRPRPLDAQSGGSLREAFAAAQPTGVAAPAPQPARRTGSPIIDPGIQPGALTLALSALVGVSALAGRYGLAVPVLLLQAVTAAGWFRLNGMWPARQGIALAALGGVVADAAILAASSQSSAPTVIAGTLGAFFVLVLVLQIFKPSNPDERFYALTVSASATVVTVLGAAFLAVGNGKAVLAGALAAGVSAAVSALLRRPAALGFGAGAVAGLAVGAGIAAATGLGLVEGALLGIAAGACGLIGRRVAAYDFPSRFVHMTAGVALPLAAAAPIVYLIAR